MLQSVMSSQQRLHQTAEVLATIGSAVVRAEAALRAPPTAAGRGTGPRPPLVTATSSAEKASAGGTRALAASLDTSFNSTFSAALSVANARGLDGTFLFAGGDGAAPFARDGSFRGAPSTTILSIDGAPPSLVISGSALTAAAPFALAVDVLPELARALAATTGSDGRKRNRCRAQLQRATHQITFVQSKLAHAIAVLAGATSVIEDAIAGSDPSGPGNPKDDPAHLAQAFGAIEAARSLAERTLAIFPTLT
jgi:hypothetical protein